MCIRDRDTVADSLKSMKAKCTIGKLVNSRKKEIKFFRIEGCLLYTSDAADERSSVDLGGRRIIKKKTKRCIERTSSHTKQKKTKNQEH